MAEEDNMRENSQTPEEAVAKNVKHNPRNMGKFEKGVRPVLAGAAMLGIVGSKDAHAQADENPAPTLTEESDEGVAHEVPEGISLPPLETAGVTSAVLHEEGEQSIWVEDRAPKLFEIPGVYGNASLTLRNVQFATGSDRHFLLQARSQNDSTGTRIVLDMNGGRVRVVSKNEGDTEIEKRWRDADIGSGHDYTIGAVNNDVYLDVDGQRVITAKNAADYPEGSFYWGVGGPGGSWAEVQVAGLTVQKEKVASEVLGSFKPRWTIIAGINRPENDEQQQLYDEQKPFMTKRIGGWLAALHKLHPEADRLATLFEEANSLDTSAPHSDRARVLLIPTYIRDDAIRRPDFLYGGLTIVRFKEAGDQISYNFKVYYDAAIQPYHGEKSSFSIFYALHALLIWQKEKHLEDEIGPSDAYALYTSPPEVLWLDATGLSRALEIYEETRPNLADLSIDDVEEWKNIYNAWVRVDRKNSETWLQIVRKIGGGYNVSDSEIRALVASKAA